MNTAKKYGAGMRVKIVPQHWLRGGAIGQLVRFEQRGQNNWLVKFDRSFPGGGIDGDKLWLGEREFVEVTDEDISPNSMGGPNDEAESPCLPADLKGVVSQPFHAHDNGSRNDLG